MTENTHLVFSSDGSPFTDFDAAEYKAAILSRQIGEPFEAVSHEGGYVVRCVSSATNSLPPVIADSGNGGFDALPDMTGMDTPRQNVNSSQNNSTIVTTPSEDASGNNEEPLTAANITPPVQNGTTAEINRQSRYPEVFKLRPALRGYYWQYCMMLLGGIVYYQPTLLLYMFMTEQELYHSDRAWIGEVVPNLLGNIGLGIALYSLAKVLFHYFSHLWIIGEDHVEAKIGIIARKSGSGNIQVADCQSFFPRQGIIEAVFLGTGNVELATSGTSSVDIIMQGVLDPEDLIKELKKRKKVAIKKRYQG